MDAGRLERLYELAYAVSRDLRDEQPGDTLTPELYERLARALNELTSVLSALRD